MATSCRPLYCTPWLNLPPKVMEAADAFIALPERMAAVAILTMILELSCKVSIQINAYL